MIVGIGTDIIEVERIRKHIDAGFGFREKVFTQKEIAYCEGKVNKAQNYAARFSAKEAFLKAVGTGMRQGLAFTDVEVVNNELGKPEMHLHGQALELIKRMGVTNLQISMTHLRDWVNAIVILER